ncbi:Ubiquitin-like modifier-activating enzyme atg7 [Papilio machaon]|uniref:Ubiquitin-like modifier-activating enzyme atg7 n=1 Tax=Papilio machaon TaxID=76193 RepID=A0A0N1PI60_PAPMA|nr:Ubiquitin-like modifier-activating enzyme atg7 [Papilio machaon]
MSMGSGLFTISENSCNSKSIFAHIPMPGYPVGEDLMEEMYNNVKLVTDAIVEHDVIFLLLDSREARWLPTVIAALHGKVTFILR